jgi:hypothetical protein
MKYRKLPGRVYQWHNHPSCPEWPEAGYLERENPAKKVICLHCASITKLGTKTTKPEPDKQ